MSAINTALSTLIKCACIRSYNKLFRKPPTRLANFLALVEIASESYWLIFLFVIKPGYLPEQSGSHGPGERAAHLTGVSGRSHPAEITEEKPSRLGFHHSNEGEHRRGQEKGEKMRAGQTVSQILGWKWWKESQSRSLGGTCTYI